MLYGNRDLLDIYVTYKQFVVLGPADFIPVKCEAVDEHKVVIFEAAMLVAS